MSTLWGKLLKRARPARSLGLVFGLAFLAVQALAPSHELSHATSDAASLPCAVCVVNHDKTFAPAAGPAWTPSAPTVLHRVSAPLQAALLVRDTVAAQPRAPPAA